MNDSGLPSLQSLLPPNGVAFFTPVGNPIGIVSRDLCKLAAFLQDFRPYATLIQYADWLQHDGLLFKEDTLDCHGLFALVATPRSLLDAMTGDEQVFVGISPEDNSWYLRFLVDWDDSGEALVGEYSLTLAPLLVAKFNASIVPQLDCSISNEDSIPYFDRISV
jgi:hypothetical protein